MKITTFKSNNSHLFSFFIAFKGTDQIGGERHFLEHLIFAKTKTMNKPEIAQKLASLGVGDLFSACTSNTAIMFSGTYLKKYEEEIAETLGELLFSPDFTDLQVKNEAKIILEEFRGAPPLEIELMLRLEKLYKTDLSVIGTTEKKIKSFTLDTLYALHRSLFNSANLEIAVSDNANKFLKTIKKQCPEGGSLHHYVTVCPKDLYFKTKNTATNLITILFDQKIDDSLRAYRAIKGSIEGKLWSDLREKQQLFYYAGLKSNMFEGQIPFPALEIETTEGPQKVIGKVLDALELEDLGTYNHIKTAIQLENYLLGDDPLPLFESWGGIESNGITLEKRLKYVMPKYAELVEYAKDFKKSVIAIKIIEAKK